MTLAHPLHRPQRASRLGAAILAVSIGAAATIGVPPVPGPGAPPAAAAGAGSCAPVAPLTAAAQNATVGVTPTAVHVGNVSVLSGPVPGLFEGAPTGVRAYFGMVNAQGGVDGRKLDLDGYDDAFNGANNTADTQQAAAKDFALVGSFSLFDGYGCKVLAGDPAVPDVSVTLDPGTNDLPNVFSAEPVGQGEELGPILYWKRLYPAAVEHAGSILADIPQVIAEWDVQKATMEHAGYHFVYTSFINPLTSDMTPEIIAMRDAGVQAVCITNLDYQLDAIFLLDAAQQGWHPQLVFSGGPAYADQFVRAAGGAGNVDGVWLGIEQALYLGQDRAKIPADNQFLTWVARVSPGWVPDLYTLFGWASAQLFVQALRAAGPDPTRGKVLAALRGITSFNASGLLAPTDPAAKRPAPCYLLARIVDGRYDRVADPPVGFRCDAPYYFVPGAAPGGSTGPPSG